LRKKKFAPGKAEYSGLYRLAAWRALRADTFHRDSLICQICGALCAGAYPAPDSPVADHIRPHRGALALFLDPDNLQTLCKACHDGAKARIESRGYDNAPGPDGWPLDPLHPANRKA
jgi:5-methylcytosine-specific restriction protein A